MCGFRETFRDNTPSAYAGIRRDNTNLHIAGMEDKELAITVGAQAMVRIVVGGIEPMYSEYQKLGAKYIPAARYKPSLGAQRNSSRSTQMEFV